MPTKDDVHKAKNGRYYVRLPGGQTQFISDAAARKLLEEDPPEQEFNIKELGTILRGFVEAARGQEAALADEKLIVLGRELFQNMPSALAHFHVRSDEWNNWFRVAPVRISSTTIWLPPVIGSVSSCFGSRMKQGTRDDGIAISCAVGMPIIAPVDLEIREVGFKGRAGRFIVADAVRENGTFEGDGYRLTFAHLSSVLVKREQVVHRGDTLALSGDTGDVESPGLHFKVEWIDEGMFRENKVAIDPLALIDEAVFAGAEPRPVAGGSVAALAPDNKPLSVDVAPRTGHVTIARGAIDHDADVEGDNPSNIAQALQRITDEGMEGNF